MIERIYLLTDSQDKAVAKANLTSALDQETVQLQILSETEQSVQEGQVLHFIGNNEGDPDFEGRILGRTGQMIQVRSTSPLDKSARKNLRVDIDFTSLIYPVSGKWTGRRQIRGIDLSCGGVAFYCGEKLQVGEIMEMVLPMTENPLILQVQVLRIRDIQGPLTLYAGRFLDMIHDEETMVRKAVFGIQIQSAR